MERERFYSVAPNTRSLTLEATDNMWHKAHVLEARALALESQGIDAGVLRQAAVECGDMALAVERTM